MPYLKEQIADDGMHYVLLDEVQLLGEFEAVLNSLIRKKNVDVYVTGSNARFLSKDVIRVPGAWRRDSYVSAEFLRIYVGLLRYKTGRLE